MDWSVESDILKGLLLLYSLQTLDEQASGTTAYLNDVGFSGAEAPFMTSIAQQILNGRPISEKQFQVVKASVIRHKRQIESFGIDHINLPATAVVYKKQDANAFGKQGHLFIEYGRLNFWPNIFPSKVEGFKWQKDSQGRKVWTAPLNLDNLRRAQENFPDTSISDELQEWIDKRQTLELTSFEGIVKGTSLEAQTQAASFAVQHGRVLISLGPGTGKTRTAIMGAEKLAARVLIVCPLSLTRTWRNEILKWTETDREKISIWHGYVGQPTDWVITNYDTVVRQMVLYDEKETSRNGKIVKEKVNWRAAYNFSDFFEVLIVDESILIKNRDTQRTRAVKALAKEFPNVWELSGAPTSRFYDDMFSQLHILDHQRFSSYWKFAGEYCRLENNGWGTSVVANKPDAAERLRHNLRDIYFSRTQDEVLDLPPFIEERMEIEMPAAQQRVYDEMEQTFQAILDEEEGDRVLAPNVLSQLTRLIQFASNPVLVGGDNVSGKWQAITELLDFVPMPAIIWTTYIKTADMISEMLISKKLKVGILTGNTAEADRQMNVDAMQEGRLDLIVAHPGVGKFGFTLNRARTSIYLERSYNGDDYFQSMYRIRRIGTTESPYLVHLLSARNSGDPTTVDHVIDRILTYRKDSNLRLTSGLMKQAFSGDLK